ncbi:MAG: SEL1-like repeat protein [Rhodospirillales bacterium]|nr:SEL1-like repeat protein [Rhodospirillales bacterium]HIJ92136.1 SEL1-like repeat protein [Rhodospirillaceae bacterium]
MERYREDAARGDAKAQLYLGNMYAKGLGVAQDDTQAASWYRKAAAQGGEEGKRARAALARPGVSIEEEAAAGQGAG